MPVAATSRALATGFEAVTRSTSVGKDQITITEARKVVALLTADGEVTADESRALIQAAARYKDSFSPSGALEFAYQAQQAGIDAAALPTPRSGARAQAVLDAFAARVSTSKDGTRSVGVAAVRAAYAEALKDGSLTSDEKIGLSRLQSAIDPAWRASSTALRELAQIRANHRLPNLPLGDATGAVREG